MPMPEDLRIAAEKYDSQGHPKTFAQAVAAGEVAYDGQVITTADLERWAAEEPEPPAEGG